MMSAELLGKKKKKSQEGLKGWCEQAKYSTVESPERSELNLQRCCMFKHITANVIFNIHSVGHHSFGHFWYEPYECRHALNFSINNSELFETGLETDRPLGKCFFKTCQTTAKAVQSRI